MVFHIYVSWVLLMEKDPARVGRWFIHVYASGWKTARVVVLLFEYGGWVGWGGILTFMYHAYRRGCYAAATSLVRGWLGWGGILTFMYHAYRRGCYAAATSLVRGWLGWGGILTFMYHAYRRGCYAAATSLVRGWVGGGGILTFMYHAYTICFMKLAITVRASSASPRKRNGETC